MPTFRHFARILTLLLSVLLFLCLPTHGQSDFEEPLRLGFFVAGKYTVHEHVRNELYRQLVNTLGEETFQFVSEGYGSGDWKRDSCRQVARHLASIDTVDIMVTMGPWVVEDLLEAGYTGPIVAMHRFDPVMEGLVDSSYRPRDENLTVDVVVNRLATDFSTMVDLVQPKKLAVLYFPTGDERPTVEARLRQLAESQGIEVSFPVGEDIYGAYAFFKAYNGITERLDAVYIPHLWGLDDTQIASFLRRLREDRVASVTSDGLYLVQSGALVSNSGFTHVREAVLAARKIAAIAEGVTPADLMTLVEGETGLVLNEATAEACYVRLPATLLSTAQAVPRPAPEDRDYYSLTDAVNRVRTLNPRALAVNEALAAVDAAAGESRSRLFPRITAEGNIGYLDDNGVNNLRGEVKNGYWSGHLKLTQTVFSLADIRRTREAVVQRSRADLTARSSLQALDMALEVQYLEYLEATEVSRLLEFERSVVDRAQEMARAWMVLEEADALDANRLEVARHDLTSQMRTVEARISSARAALNALFNLPGDRPLALDTLRFQQDNLWYDYDRISDILMTRKARAHFISRLVAVALQSNSELQSHEAQIAFKEAQLNSARGAFWPRLDLDAGLHLADSLEDIAGFREMTSSWSVRGRLTLPIFLGGSRFAERSRLTAEKNAAEYEKDAAALELMRAVRHEAEAVLSALDNLRPLIRGRHVARQNMIDLQGAYEREEIGLTELLAAQHMYHQASGKAVATRYHYLKSLARLVYLVGWTPHDNGTTFRQEFFLRLEETLRG